MIEELHGVWTPHAAQVQVGRDLISEKVTEVFAQCGRNFGKTDLVAYLLWRWAKAHPGSENYYFAPYMKQAREILWASRRVQEFGPARWIAGEPNSTEMRIRFTNGSFIKLDGSDNVEAYRGVKPKGLSVFDEFKDFRPEFYDAFDPNRAAHNSPLFIIGTPPDRDCQYTSVADEYSKNPLKRFFQFPTSANPHISKDWLQKKKNELYLRGEGDVWEREYEAKFVKGGAAKIFPMISKSFIKPHDQIMQTLLRDRKKLQWFMTVDPAAATCFAGLFCALNPYTKTWYILDEVYERNQAEMSVDKIGRRLLSMRHALWDDADAWFPTYDEAETWFANEFMDRFGEGFHPSQKAKNDKEDGLSLIKDIFLQGKVVISSRCKWLYWELDNYFKDKNGKIPKKDDHLIDCFRYTLGAAHYVLNEETEYREEEDEDFRGAKISDDFPGLDPMGVQTDEGDDY